MGNSQSKGIYATSADYDPKAETSIEFFKKVQNKIHFAVHGENAAKLGIDLGKVDTVILSHGHYDHSGGIISFAKINERADIYMQRLATGDYYSDDGVREGRDRYRYIGIDKAIADLPQVKLLDGDTVIDDEISVFVMDESAYKRPFTNSRLKEKVDGSYVQDNFKHEQYVVVSEESRKILISGCAHNGILNILCEYERKYGSQPDAVISEFHLMKKSDYTDDEFDEIIDTAQRLKDYRTTFYTCHCTGVKAYESMRCIMGDQLKYVHSGEEVRLKFHKSAGEKRRKQLLSSILKDAQKRGLRSVESDEFSFTVIVTTYL